MLLLNMEKFLGHELYSLVIHDRDKKISMEMMELFVKEKLKSNYYLISMENEDSNKHYHILVKTSVNKNDKQNKTLRKLINDFGVKGKGNLSTSLVKDRKQMMKYTLKDDGEIKSYGIPKTEIDLFKKLSYKKKNFSKELNALEEKFIGSSMGNKKFAMEYIKLQLQYGYNMRSSSQKPYILKMVMKKNPDVIQSYVEEMFKYEQYI